MYVLGTTNDCVVRGTVGNLLLHFSDNSQKEQERLNTQNSVSGSTESSVDVFYNCTKKPSAVELEILSKFSCVVCGQGNGSSHPVCLLLSDLLFRFSVITRYYW